MKIRFRIRTNRDVPYINTARFKAPDGSIIIVDRDDTYGWYDEFDEVSGIYIQDMQWEHCYILDNELQYYLTNADDIGEFVEFEIEDDADDDYFVEVLDWEQE